MITADPVVNNTLLITLLVVLPSVILLAGALYYFRYSEHGIRRRCSLTIQRYTSLAESISAPEDSTTDGGPNAELQTYLQQARTTNRFRFTHFHCAASCDADPQIVRSMLLISPELVATKDTRGRDAVQLATHLKASTTLVAEMVVRSIQAGTTLDGWHALLEGDDCCGYIPVVLDLVELEATAGRPQTFSHLLHANMKQSIAEQVT